MFTASELDALYSAYPNVTRIDCKLRMAHYTIKTDITAFCARHASYTKERHTQEDFAALRHCPVLKALDIGHNSVTDLEFLRLLPKLELLILADNDLTDITPLEYETELKYLELINNDITDISPLSGLSELIDLHIGKNRITDISPLYGLKKLDRLWLANNPIPGGQIERIRELLPGATVNDTATGKPTAEGWRQGHPRYLKVVQIFNNNKYIPFP